MPKKYDMWKLDGVEQERAWEGLTQAEIDSYALGLEMSPDRWALVKAALPRCPAITELIEFIRPKSAETAG
ncbi:MAG: hypothetical protein WC480_00870 [Patescibacteria group bacterium]